MFATTSHDFGTVARGQRTEFEFVLENLYVEDVHIASVRASCSCTTPEIKTDTLKTHQKGAILAKYNTAAFLGPKGATLTVIFDKPFWAEVQLNVRGFIRSDVLLQPGSVDFGSVDQERGAKGPSRSATRAVRIGGSARSAASIRICPRRQRSWRGTRHK